MWVARAVWHKTLDISLRQKMSAKNVMLFFLSPGFLLRCTCVGGFVTAKVAAESLIQKNT